MDIDNSLKTHGNGIFPWTSKIGNCKAIVSLLAITDPLL